MTADPCVSLERRGSVAWVTLNRPERLNAFDRTMGDELGMALERAAGAESLRAVVLTGSGRAFSSGADLQAAFPGGEQVRRQLEDSYKPALLAIADMPKPVIAAVNGPAAGIGMSLALACDLRVMGRSAYLLAPFNRLGLLPDGGACWWLPRLLGYSRALEVALEAERLDAQRCRELGLANRVVEDADVQREAEDWAQSLSRGAPLAVAATKQAMRAAMTLSLSAAMDMEAELQERCVDSEDAREGLAAFLEGRPPRFGG